MVLESVITCPSCGTAKSEAMPTDACQFFYECKSCGTRLKPKPGDCCVFCSYGDVPCPPMQEERMREGGRLLRDLTNRADMTARPFRDWAGNIRTYGWVWGLPIVAIGAGLFVDVRFRTGIWTVALIVMGTACVLNARRCGRTHCWFTGPYYFAMILPVVMLGSGVFGGGLLAWVALAVLILAGSKIIWWATERAWGRYS